jgi:hypothetical protein
MDGKHPEKRNLPTGIDNFLDNKRLKSMKIIALILTFLVLSNFVKGQDKMGFGNMPEGVDSAGIGTVTTWVKKTVPTGGFTMTTTSTSPTWSPQAVTNTGAVLHWSVTGAVSYEVDANKPMFDFSTPGTKYITVTNADNFSNVTIFQCISNQLTSLNVSGLSNLTSLYCYSNQLTSLDVSGLSNLTQLYCYNNQLTSLNVSGLSNLGYLSCHSNQLTSLNVSGLSNFTRLYCQTNQLTTSAINIILDQLIAINNSLGYYLDARSQVGGGCGDTAKIAALDAIWDRVYITPCN